MYREIAGTDERVRAIPGVRDRRVRATKVRLYLLIHYLAKMAAVYRVFNPIISFVTSLHVSSLLLYLLTHYLAKMAAVYRVFNPIRSFVTYLHVSSFFIVLTDSSSCQDGRYLLIDSAFGSWNSGRGLLNVITSVRSWLEMDALYMRSDLCRILRTLCIALLSNSWSISGSCQKKLNKQITWLENLKWKHWIILLCIYKHFTIGLYVSRKLTVFR